MSTMAKVMLTVAAIYSLFALFSTWDDDSKLERALNFAVIPAVMMSLVEMWSQS